MLSIFNSGVAGEPALQIDPVDGLPLIRALRGAWFYPKDRLGNVSRDLPKKNHPHSDVSDAFCYLIGRIAPSAPKWTTGPIKVNTTFDPRAYYAAKPVLTQENHSGRSESQDMLS